MSLQRLIARPLSAADAQEVLQRAIHRAQQAGAPRRIYVFGSAARDELTDASDVDLAILYDDAAALRQGRQAYHGQRDPHFLWPVDVLFFTVPEFDRRAAIGGVCAVIRDEGRLVFERGPT
jgi:predicted nucleotidyltransferase